MPTYAFVTAPATSATTLLNLDNQSPFSVVGGTQTPPPVRRSSTTSSSVSDGDNVSQTSYADRVLTIPLRVELKSTAEQQAAGIQAVGRLLDGPQWLQWQHDGMTKAVWFRTKYGDMDVVDDILNDKPRRTVTLTIVAEPFAYGAAVTGTATIANDPTVAAASNPMSYVFPTIQGDVVTPLSLTAALGAGAPMEGSILAVASGPSAPTTPLRVAAGSVSTTTGWTATLSSADSAAIGGTASQFVKASGTLSPFANFTLTPPLGDYRVLVRARPSGSDATLSVVLDGFTSPNKRALTVDGSEYWYYDFGVMRAPQSAIQRTGVLQTALLPRPISIQVYAAIAGATGTVWIDEVLLVPAGLDDDAASRLMILGEVSVLTGLQVDSASEVAFDGSATAFRAIPVAGGFPAVLPGVRNVLTFIRRPSPDSKSATTDISWLYYPRYLYIRPATT